MKVLSRVRYIGAPAVVALALGVAIFGQDATAQTTQHYLQTNLVSNQASLAPTVDASLVNSWGLARSSKSPWWVADNGTGMSTLYNGTGAKQGLIVTIPSGDTSVSPTGTPTGTVYNGDSTAFLLAPGKASVFLFVTEDGTISGWNPGVSAGLSVIMVNHKSASVYKGVTIATVETASGPQEYLYAADFRQGRVEVFDSTFKPVQLSGKDEDDWGDNDHDHGNSDHSFDDPRLPKGYAPFNVQNIGGNVYVSFAKQDSAKHDEVDGAGLGFVDVFSPRGRLLGRLQPGPWFNGPWGMALASSDFGSFSHDVLVGQFGSGELLAFDPVTGKFKGKLMGTNNQPIHIDGLWAIAFGNDASAGPATTLYFAAGPDGETNGLFGTLTAVENVQGSHQ
jgi:uncharacterized protein (TIGR03118 family)